MIDGAILSIIPPLAAAILTYVVANKKARIEQAKILTDIQIQAIEQVRIAEEKMRSEMWAELKKVSEENLEVREEMKQQRLEIHNLKEQLELSGHLRITLTEQVKTLEHLVETYKNRIVELEGKFLCEAPDGSRKDCPYVKNSSKNI